MVLRRLRQKVRGFFWVLEETTTIVESKYLNPAKLRYSNTKLYVEVKKKMVFKEDEEWEEGEDEEWEEEEW
jgi:hypothetical protein